MFIHHDLTALRSLLYHSEPASKLAAGSVIGALLLVAIDVAVRPGEALSAVDASEIKTTSARPVSGPEATPQLVDPDPAKHAEGFSGTTAAGVSPQ